MKYNTLLIGMVALLFFDVQAMTGVKVSLSQDSDDEAESHPMIVDLRNNGLGQSGPVVPPDLKMHGQDSREEVFVLSNPVVRTVGIATGVVVGLGAIAYTGQRTIAWMRSGSQQGEQQASEVVTEPEWHKNFTVVAEDAIASMPVEKRELILKSAQENPHLLLFNADFMKGIASKKEDLRKVLILYSIDYFKRELGHILRKDQDDLLEKAVKSGPSVLMENVNRFDAQQQQSINQLLEQMKGWRDLQQNF